MPPPPVIDLERVDHAQIVLTQAEIYERLPQRCEFQLLDGICLLDVEQKQIVAFADVSTDAWWARGHLPGRPILPGVLMLEMAGQLSALITSLCGNVKGFLGFGGVNDCRFREAVSPPSRLTLLCVVTQFRSRRVVSKTQGVVDGRIVFEAEIIGVAMPG